MDAFVLVVDKAIALGGKCTGGVARIHAVCLAKEEEGKRDPREVHHPRGRGAVAADAREGGVGFGDNIGIFGVVVVEVVLAVEIEAEDLLQL